MQNTDKKSTPKHDLRTTSIGGNGQDNDGNDVLVVAPARCQDLLPIAGLAKQSFPKVFHLHTEKDEEGKEWAPAGIAWEVEINIDTLEKMGYGVGIQWDDGRNMTHAEYVHLVDAKDNRDG